MIEMPIVSNFDLATPLYGLPLQHLAGESHVASSRSGCSDWLRRKMSHLKFKTKH